MSREVGGIGWLVWQVDRQVRWRNRWVGMLVVRWVVGRWVGR